MREISEAIITSGMPRNQPGNKIRVSANHEIQTDEFRGSGKRIPDISIRVPLYPEMDRLFTGVVWEVGVTQSLASLKQRASMWLSNKGMPDNIRIHLVILVHAYEEEGPKEYLNEKGEVILSKHKAKSMKWDWPKEWFENRTIVEEANKRGGMKKSVKNDLKKNIALRLLEENKCGRLIPSLMELVGAEVFVYRRREQGSEVERQDSEVAEGLAGDEQGSEVEQDWKVEQGSDNDQGSRNEQDSEVEQGSDSEEASGDEQDSEVEQGSDSEQGSGDEQGSDSEQGSGDEQDSEVERGSEVEEGSQAEQGSHAANIAIASAPGSQPNSTKEGFDDSDEVLGIHKITSIPFMRSSAPLPNLPPDGISISIGELYGPLSTEPDILNRVPPILRPHINEKIHFRLDQLVETLLLDCNEMKDGRARDRASRIVDRAWAEVEVEEQRLKNERHRLRALAEREGRRVARRVRNMDESAEEQGGEGARVAGREQKRVRTDLVLN